jgi:hypothetical protein
MNIADLLRSVPETIWGVLLGAVLAFGATFVATRLQLAHDAKQRERERRMSLRRDIFLEAADAVAGTTDYFFKFANVEVPMRELTISTSKPGWINKLYMVASLETIEAFTQTSLALGAAAFDLLQRRFVLERVNNKLTLVTEQVEAAGREQQSAGEIAAALAKEAPSSEVLEKRKHVQDRWEQSLHAYEKVIIQQRELIDERLALQKALLEHAIRHSTTYQARLRHALVQLRSELDFSIDLDKFEKLAERIDGQLRPEFQKVFDAIGKD